MSKTVQILDRATFEDSDSKSGRVHFLARHDDLNPDYIWEVEVDFNTPYADNQYAIISTPEMNTFSQDDADDFRIKQKTPEGFVITMYMPYNGFTGFIHWSSHAVIEGEVGNGYYGGSS